MHDLIVMQLRKNRNDFYFQNAALTFFSYLRIKIFVFRIKNNDFLLQIILQPYHLTKL